MRSARMVLATAAASAVLAISAPGAYAADGGWNSDDSSQSTEHSTEHGKEHGKDSSHDGPHGGMHTGGGALTAVRQDGSDNARDPKFDPNTYKDHGSGSSSSSDSSGWSGDHDKGSSSSSNSDGWSGDHDKGSSSSSSSDGWSGEHDKPHGGMHTGGGALAMPTVTAGGLAVLAVAGTGLYAARRRKTAGSVA
ncbi:hypothetical protein ABZT17_43825 [Streptomyces sp. NPDC005648]|uniref:hypothetical protein n=1 Tax=Streptomyces sp. NPDC005648 TaxID=3157044 RepID=UPI0033BBE317